MKGAGKLRTQQNFAQFPGGGERAGRIAVLVIDNFQFRFCRIFAQPHHRMNKTRSACAVQPGKPGNHMIRTQRPHQLFPGKFALPVDCVSAVRPVKFGIGMIRAAVENVIRGNGNQPDMMPMTCRRDISGTERIEPVCGFPFGFTAVHRSHGGTVNHGVRFQFGQQSVKFFRRRNIPFGQVGRQYFKSGQFGAKGSAEHPASTGEHDFHFGISSVSYSRYSASLNSGFFMSFGERMK